MPRTTFARAARPTCAGSTWTARAGSSTPPAARASGGCCSSPRSPPTPEAARPTAASSGRSSRTSPRSAAPVSGPGWCSDASVAGCSLRSPAGSGGARWARSAPARPASGGGPVPTPPGPARPGGDPPLAYHDAEFVDSDAARPLRILAEYLQPLEAFRRERVHDTIVFFGSARLTAEGPLARYYEDARELARLVTAWSGGLKSPARRFLGCTAGGGGLMGAGN